MNIPISDGANKIVSSLENAGFSAYIVGGAVRDILMGKTPHDYDFTTSATPPEIKKVFNKTVDTGILHGTVTVIENSNAYEVTTFRSEEGYLDSRHPDKVTFGCSLEKDLQRRDFTINAMCYSKKDGLIDSFGGQEDIKNKIIRTVGNPEQRFSEDALRMLRAVRFSAQLDFDIEEETKNAIKTQAHLIKKISGERIFGELNKILLSDNPEKVILLRETGLMQHILPELDRCFSVPQKNKYHIYNVGDHIIHATKETPKDLSIRWSALLHDIGKPGCMSVDSSGIIHFYGHHKESVTLADGILRRLHADNELKKDVLSLIENHDVRIDPVPHNVKRMMSKVGDNLFLKLLEIQIADNKAKNPVYLPEKLQRLSSVRAVYETVIAEGQPYLLSDLVVNGRDLIKLGFRAGREIGDTLKILLSEVMMTPSLNTRDYLLKRAKEIKKKG